MDSRYGSRLPQRPLRKSLSTSDLRRPAGVHPALPTGPRLGKENRPAPKTAVSAKRAAPAAPKPSLPAKRAKTPAKAPTPVRPKKIAPYDFKARYHDLLEKYKPLRAELLESKRELDELKEELHELREYRRSRELDAERQTERIEELNALVDALQTELTEAIGKRDLALAKSERSDRELAEVNAELVDLKFKHAYQTTKLDSAEKINRSQEQIIAKQHGDIEELQNSTQALHWERRDLHNKLQDLKGNIRVVFRVRPALAPDKPVAALNFPDVCTIEMERYEPGATRRLSKHDFKFDRVFGPTSSQEDVWEEVSCLVQSALDGYNVCIFAYGQTGSGKTYTMEGTKNAPGVIPKSCSMIFDSIKRLSKSGWKYTIHASFLEIYNEQIYDLLDPGRDPRDFDIRMVDAKGSDVYVTNLSEQEVHTAVDLLRLAGRAQMNRQTAATASNERSSRSHSVARVRLMGSHSAKSLTLTSRICLVDLAGSESAKNTQRLKETKNINRSLSELGQVILALQQKQEHVPFRNSKLTRLLEPQLGGAAKALLVAAAAPYEECSHESLSTLRFATQVGHCSTAAARRNLAIAQPTAVGTKDG